PDAGDLPPGPLALRPRAGPRLPREGPAVAPRPGPGAAQPPAEEGEGQDPHEQQHPEDDDHAPQEQRHDEDEEDDAVDDLDPGAGGIRPGVRHAALPPPRQPPATHPPDVVLVVAHLHPRPPGVSSATTVAASVPLVSRST